MKKIMLRMLVLSLILISTSISNQLDYAVQNVDECIAGQITLMVTLPGRVMYDWVLCNGQTLSISEYPDLYEAIGTTFGGDGVTNFMVPNLTQAAPYTSVDGNVSPSYFMYAPTSDSGYSYPGYLDNYIGEIILLPDTVAQHAMSNGMMMAKCDGATYSPSTFSALYALIGGNFGSQLPNLVNASPATGLSYYILLSGIYPMGSLNHENLSTLDLLPYTVSFSGLERSEGQIVTVAANNALFALLGSYYGGSSGTTFGYPDLRGISPLPNVQYYIVTSGYFPVFQ